MKLVEGVFPDNFWYDESITRDRLNNTDPTYVSYFGEKIIRFLDFAYGKRNNSRSTFKKNV